jgi:hypothetical protein
MLEVSKLELTKGNKPAKSMAIASQPGNEYIRTKSSISKKQRSRASPRAEQCKLRRSQILPNIQITVENTPTGK